MEFRDIKTIAVTAIAALFTVGASAQIPKGYYDSLKGKKGKELKNAVHEVIKDAKVLSYGSGSGHTWEGFYTTDNDDGYVVDRYSNERRRFGAKGDVVNGMNIEHSFPKSWWGGTKNQAYQDLYNLMPSDSKANSSKSNYGMGVVTNATYDNGCIKVGTGPLGSTKLWQPSAEWQGDFSRSYMYMATAYQNFSWVGEALNSLEQGDYPTLKKWAYEQYIKWSKEDPVSKTEVDRNNAVYKIQGNRNPFIDFPNLMEYIWGDSVDYAFDPNNTLCSEIYNGGNGGGTVNPGEDDTEITIYSADYTSSDGNCIFEPIQNPSADMNVWTLTSKYGWKASGYISSSKTNCASEGYVVLPEIDLEGYSNVHFSFRHALNFCSVDPENLLSVEVRSNGNTTKLEGIKWPDGDNWTFIESGSIDLSKFDGEKIKIAFHYTSTTTTAATWEIAKAAITGKKATSGIVSTPTDNALFDPSKPYTVYDVTGKLVNPHDTRKGVVIVKQGNKTFKQIKH